MSRRSVAGADGPSPGNDLAYWLRDGLAGAVAGGAGLLVMLAVLAVGAQRGVFTFDTFGSFASLVYLDRFFPPVLAGLAVFAVIGTTAWPLLFTSLEPYLPGRTIQVRGTVFSGTLWLGYVVGAYPGYDGLRLAGFLAFTLVAHVAYGFALGNVLDFFLSEYHRDVATEARASAGSVVRRSTADEEEAVDDEEDDAGAAPAPPGTAADAPAATPAADGAGTTTPDADADAGGADVDANANADAEPSGPSAPEATDAPAAASATPADATTSTGPAADAAGAAGESGAGRGSGSGGAGPDGEGARPAAGADGDRSDAATGGGGEASAEPAEAATAASTGASGGTTDDADGTTDDSPPLPPLLQFERALHRLRRAVPGDPDEVEALERAYERLQRTPPEGRPSVASDIGDHLTGLRDRVPADGDAERWLDSMENRVRQYLATRRNTSDALSLSGVRLLVDGEERSVEEMRTETATIHATVTNRGEESGVDVQVDFRGEDDVLLRSATLSAGRVPAGGRTTLETSVYVPSIATSYEARAVDPREGQRFLRNV
jgi:cytochrome c oxidase subunit 1